MAFARASVLKPDFGRPYWWRALALRDLGRLQDAISAAIASIQADPGFIYGKRTMLQERGYLPVDIGDDAMERLSDAVRACMLDEGCN